MSNSVNIADERRIRQLNEKFKIKGAHERDITFFTRLLYITLHIGSGIGAISSLYLISFNSKIEQLISFLVCGLLIVLNEFFKGKKMEYFTSMKIMSMDEDLPLNEREKAHDETPKAGLLVTVFWLVSILAVGFSGYLFGSQKVEHRFTAENYDETLRNSAETAILATQNAIQQQTSAANIKRLQAAQVASVLVWQTHKERVDAENKRNKTNNEDEALVMGLVYVLIAISIEFLLFVSRLWHEREQYAVLKSRNKQQETAKKDDKTAKKQLFVKETGTISLNKDDYERISRDYATMQAALQLSNTKISLLEDALKTAK